MISKKIDSTDLINILKIISVTCRECGSHSYFAWVKESSAMIHLSDWGSWVWWIIPKSIIANLQLLFFRLFTDQWVFRLILDLTLLLSVYMVFIILWQGESFRRQITFRERRQASSRCAVILDTFHSGVGKLHGEMYGVLVGCEEMDPSPFPSIIILSLSHAFDNSIRQPSTCKVAGLIWLPFLLDPGHINQTNGDGCTDVTTRHSLVALETLFRGPRGCHRR